MPLTRISILRGKAPAYRTALMNGVYAALRETFSVPEDDRFMTVQEHDRSDFAYGAGYLGIVRSDDVALIQITCTDSRDIPTKQALYRAIVANLSRDPGLRPEDVVIVLEEVKAENWSFGNGVASYVTPA